MNTHKAVTQFWNDFKNEQGLPENLTRIDVHSAWFIKVKNVKIDFKYFKKPRDANL